MHLILGSWLFAGALILFRLATRAAARSGPESILNTWLVGEAVACGLSATFFFSAVLVLRAVVRPGEGAMEVVAIAAAVGALAAAVVVLKFLPRLNRPTSGHAAATGTAA